MTVNAVDFLTEHGWKPILPKSDYFHKNWQCWEHPDFPRHGKFARGWTQAGALEIQHKMNRLAQERAMRLKAGK